MPTRHEEIINPCKACWLEYGVLQFNYECGELVLAHGLAPQF